MFFWKSYDYVAIKLLPFVASASSKRYQINERKEVNEWINKETNNWTNAWAWSDQLNEWMNESWMNEWMNVGMNE